MTIDRKYAEDDELFQILAYASIENLKCLSECNLNSFDRAFIKFIPKYLKIKSKDFKQLSILPFDPTARRRCILLHNPTNNEYYLIIVGAPVTLLDLALDENRNKYETIIKNSGNSGSRQLSLA